MEMFGPLCNQTVTLETDAKTLYYSLLKLKYSPSIYLKHKKNKNKYASFNNSHRNFMNRVFYQKIFKSIVLCVLQDAFHELFCVFGDSYVFGTQNVEVTKSLLA